LALRVEPGDVLGDGAGVGLDVGVELLVEGVFDLLEQGVSLFSRSRVELRAAIQSDGGPLLHGARVGGVDPIDELLEQGVVVELEALAVVHERRRPVEVVGSVAVVVIRGAQDLVPLVAVVRKLRILAAKFKDLGDLHLVRGLSGKGVERLGI